MEDPPWTASGQGRSRADVNNCVREHNLAIEKRFGTHDPLTRYQTHALGVVFGDAIEGWCNIINQGRRDTARSRAGD